MMPLCQCFARRVRDWRSPQFASIRPAALAVLLGLPALIVAATLFVRTVSRGMHVLRIATGAVALAVLLIAGAGEARFHSPQW